jgi:hypothetical protein
VLDDRLAIDNRHALRRRRPRQDAAPKANAPIMPRGLAAGNDIKAEVLPRETRPASGLAPLVEVVTVDPAVAQQLVLAIGTSAQPARPEHPTPIIKVM